MCFFFVLKSVSRRRRGEFVFTARCRKEIWPGAEFFVSNRNNDDYLFASLGLSSEQQAAAFSSVFHFLRPPEDNGVSFILDKNAPKISFTLLSAPAERNSANCLRAVFCLFSLELGSSLQESSHPTNTKMSSQLQKQRDELEHREWQLYKMNRMLSLQ